MTKFEENAVKQHRVRDYMVTGALLFATAAAATEAQAQTTAPQNNDTPAKNKTNVSHDVNVGFDNLSALVLDEKTTFFYNNFQPYVSASAQDDKGHKASVSAVELLMYDSNSKEVTPVLTKFMVELSKELKGGELFLKAGRENTQGGDVFVNAIDFAADYKDVVSFGNNAERMVLGYRKDGNFVELGTMWDTGTGKYIVCPNKESADFWGKGHLSLLAKSGVKLELEAAARLGSHNQLGIASATLATPSGFGAKALVERDFNNDDTKCLVRAYQNLKNGSKVISELVHAGKGQGVDIRLGLGKNGFQVFAEYGTKEKKAQLGVSYFFGGKKNISKKGPRDSL
ncbi:MAG: hypothetical protein IJ099_07520 [Alphaproteobacteria bacterium]|nr:hypothetical protein [Alphaproteobacteria bacterium]